MTATAPQAFLLSMLHNGMGIVIDTIEDRIEHAVVQSSRHDIRRGAHAIIASLMRRKLVDKRFVCHFSLFGRKRKRYMLSINGDGRIALMRYWKGQRKEKAA